MSGVNLYHLVLVLIFIPKCLSVENKLKTTTEILFNLTNYAIESRRIRNPCIYETSDINYFSCMNKLTAPHNYQVHGLNYYPQRPYPHPQRPYPRPQNFRPPQDTPQSIIDVLYTISKNDALRCVPRLLCEATSDTISTSRQGFTLPTLPFNLDMASIIRLLTTIDLPGGSPVPVFAKAALLGYVSKGNSDSCTDAYPQCPRDPDKLVQYLNNYNGGFFRYFSGVNPMPNPHYNQNHQGYGLLSNYYQRPNFAQKRIQNKPALVSNNDGVIFSNNDVGGNFNVHNRLPKTLSFPTDDDNRFSEFTFKKPKELPFSINEYYFNELDLQRPLPNHRVTPIIFPVRTGTGDLRLDAEELDANYKQKHYNLQNNFVSFRPERPNEGFYYAQPEDIPAREFNSNKAIFSFPV